MGNKGTKDLEKTDYEECCQAFNDYFLNSKKKLELEKSIKDVDTKFDEKAKKSIIFKFIKSLLEKEKKKNIIDKMQNIFASLSTQYDEIHKKEEEEGFQKFSENISNNEKNIINAIYISKISDDEDINEVKIHEYAKYLYGEDEVKKIEDGKNENIDEDFKKFDEDEFNITEDEINAKFIEICKEKNIDPNNYDNEKSSNPKSSNPESSNPQKKKKEEEKNPENNEHDENLNKNKYTDEDLFKYYDIIFNIDSLNNLKKNGWQLESNEEGFKKYEEKKDLENIVVSVIGNKNKGKSFILAKLSKIEIPDGFNITTKGLSVIYPKYKDKNIIFLDTAGFEIPLCENDDIFSFETNNEEFKKLKEEEKPKKIKDYLSEEEYITQTMEFTRDRQNTDYFLQKFILNSADILLCIVNQLNLSDHKFLNRIQEENKNKKIFVIHNLKTFKEKIEVEDYIKNTLLKLVTSKLTQDIYIKINSDKKEETVNNVNQNNVYYKQEFEDSDDKRDKREVIHLFMANDKSNAGNYYNESTLEFIKNQIISHTNIKQFPIIDKVKDFLFEHSGEFFNEPLENKDDLKIIEEDSHQKLKYTNEEKPFELKECYVDELGNANFIQTNYKPSYRAYKAKSKKDNSFKLFIDIEISGQVTINDPEIATKNGQNIITISGNRNLIKESKKSEENKKENQEGNMSEKPAIKNLAEYKSSYFNNKNKIFNLRIYIPIEKCIIGKLFDKNHKNGLYRFIYNIIDKKEGPIEVVWNNDDNDDNDDEYEI